ncbi:hypothetical protein SERLA73DRAFT_105921, partial [Serpula lacrymans var. lacrymans S7.3]
MSASPAHTKVADGAAESPHPESPAEHTPSTTDSTDNTPEQPQPSTEPEASTSTTADASSTPAAAGTWQAVWSPQHNAYYFYNSVTQETTWTNPLEAAAVGAPTGTASPDPSSASPHAGTSAAASHYATLQANAMAQGIDPSLAHLDPTLASSSAVPANFTYSAKFNARTGTFAKVDARDPSHLSEFERAKRMSEFYFDVGAWEKEVEERKEAEEHGEGRKRKRPTKKDLERFKEQKKQKKIAKT